MLPPRTHPCTLLPPAGPAGRARHACGVLLVCACRSRHTATLARRRREYADMVPEFYDIPNSERSEDEQAALRQVRWGARALPPLPRMP